MDWANVNRLNKIRRSSADEMRGLKAAFQRVTRVILPFPILGFYGKNTMPYTGTMAYRRVSRPLPVSRVLSEEQRTAGCSLILSVHGQ